MKPPPSGAEEHRPDRRPGGDPGGRQAPCEGHPASLHASEVGAKWSLVRSILRYLGLDAGPEDSRDTETVRRIASELERLAPERAAWVACFAYVLARVARADLEFTDAEIRSMEDLIARATDLPAPQAALVTRIARHQATHVGGTEDYLVTRQFREISERGERIELVRCLFAIGAADGSISQLEDQTIVQIGRELGLTAPEVAACRSGFRDKLAVLQGMPGGGSEPPTT